MPPGLSEPEQRGGRKLRHRHLGRMAYLEALAIQQELANALRTRQADGQDTLLTVEHEPVITIGRRGREEDVLIPPGKRRQLGLEVHHVDRGGEVTYHGPGQLVIYPILRLDPARYGVADLVRGLAACLIELLEESGIAAVYDPDRPGLWVGESKIGAIGMRVSGGVTSHGAALNVTNDLEPFEWIVPCGIPRCGVTSMARELGEAGPQLVLEPLAERLARLFAVRFGYQLDLLVHPATGCHAPHGGTDGLDGGLIRA